MSDKQVGRNFHRKFGDVNLDERGTMAIYSDFLGPLWTRFRSLPDCWLGTPDNTFPKRDLKCEHFCSKTPPSLEKTSKEYLLFAGSN